jgi:hypothetical protein
MARYWGYWLVIVLLSILALFMSRDELVFGFEETVVCLIVVSVILLWIGLSEIADAIKESKRAQPARRRRSASAQLLKSSIREDPSSSEGVGE